jgi:hypothetical protein
MPDAASFRLTGKTLCPDTANRKSDTVRGMNTGKLHEPLMM